VHPAQQLQRQTQQLNQLQQRMQRALVYRRQQQHWQWQSLAQRLVKAMRTLRVQRSGRVDNLAQHLILLDPKQVLERGYSLVQDASGGVVSDAGELAAGAELHITFARGWARAEVKERG
jgi:exodeoxyribonuclease VII large subunit